MTYRVTGEFAAGKGRQSFERDVDAESANHAEDKVYAELTSEHGISRANVEINAVEEQ